MQVFIFRHGEKESSFDGDPNLTLRGRAQATKLAEWVQQGRLPSPTLLLSSPKKRAQQTFEPLAKNSGLKLNLDTSLTEKTHQETPEQFRDRVQKTVQNLNDQAGLQKGQCVYIVSHMDWLEEALSLIPSDIDFNLRPLFWAPCQYTHFVIRDHLWSFIKTQQIREEEI